MALLALLSCGPGQAAGDTSAFDSARAWKHLEAQVAIGSRPSGSPGAEKTREYIVQQLKSLGLEPFRESFTAQTPVGPIEMANLYVDLPAKVGAKAPVPMVVIGSHFDTKRCEFPFVGANDSASSTAVLLELARAMVAERPDQVSWRLLFLDGEEAVRTTWVDPDNRYGSRHHVAELQRTGEIGRVKAFVLLDMVGDKDLALERDTYSDSRLMRIFGEAAHALGKDKLFNPRAQPISDDHLSFMAADVPSIDLIDLDYGPGNRFWHTQDDVITNCAPESLGTSGRLVLAALPQVAQFAAR